MTDLVTEPTTTGTPWHLRGNFAPVTDELDVRGLEVIGRLPEGLTGTYVRQSFNPRTGWSPHWFFGHGMLHAVDLDDSGDGSGARYHNRYVETPFAEFDGSGMEWILDPSASPANTHVVRHNGQWLALEEQHKPFALDDDLNTLGVEDFGGAVTSTFTAHPKVCPITGELLAFGYNLVTEPHLTYFRISPTGEVLAVEPIDIPNPVMMHDWNVTENHVVFMDLPVRFGLDRAMQGEEPFFWDPEAGARLGLMPRDGSNADVTWHEIDPCYVFHPLNAYEDGDRVELLVCRQPHAMVGGFDDIEGARANLWRWSIDRTTGTVTETQIDDRIADFPRVDDRRTGLAGRFGYLTQIREEPGIGAAIGSELYKYDLADGTAEVHTTNATTRLGEPVFAPAGPDAAEDDGWVLVYAHDEAEGVTELRVIAAGDFSGEPVARVVLPQRVPYGAHGSWLPAG
jgi:carotenoid cleavage dioxygenase-like enzyme